SISTFGMFILVFPTSVKADVKQLKNMNTTLGKFIESSRVFRSCHPSTRLLGIDTPEIPLLRGYFTEGSHDTCQPVKHVMPILFANRKHTTPQNNDKTSTSPVVCVRFYRIMVRKYSTLSNIWAIY